MNSRLRNLLIFSLIVVLAMIPVLIFGDRGSHDLFEVKEENISLNIQNSAKGLELLEQIDLFKRLAADDLKLIEHIARSELGLVREGELLFVSESAADAGIPQSEIEGIQPTFRFLTEEEFEELLNFDLKSFEFYEELSEFEKQAYPSSFNLDD